MRRRRRKLRRTTRPVRRSDRALRRAPSFRRRRGPARCDGRTRGCESRTALASSSRERRDNAIGGWRVTVLAAINRVARGSDFGDDPARVRTGRATPQIRIEKVEPRRATEKSADAAIEMHEVHDSAIPRDAAGAPEVLEVDEV